MRNIVFGVEDGLVSTVGLLSGIAAAGISKSNILTTGIVLVLVEGFAMAVGSLLSEHSTEEYEAAGNVPFGHAFAAGLVMFASYLISGMVPLVPYALFSPAIALPISISASLIAILGLGAISGRLFGVSPVRKAIEMLLLGGLAIGLGLLTGRLSQSW